MKTRRIILPLLTVVIVIGFLTFSGSTAMAADTDTVTGVVYSVADGKATITGFTMPDGFGGDLIIPSTLGGATVTSIGKEAFQYCGAWGGSINSITIPGGVTSIGEAAFKECRAKSINIPDSVTSIGDSAFNHCHAENITIPEGVTSIGDYTFQGCLAKSIIIPGSVTSIGSCAFNGCTFTSIIIPEGVTSIGGLAFYYCSIASITIPGSMKSIGLEAFKNCENLASVTILPGITELGQLMFDECNNLTRVDIPVSVTKITYNTFKNCPNVTIYGSVGSYAEQYAENNKINFASNGTYQIVLDKNGGDTEAIPNVVGAAGEFGSLSINPPTRQGWNFAGWNTEPGGTGTTITDATVINKPLTIYAQWTMDTPAGFNDNDFQKLLAFAQQGENAAKLGWDLTKPGTWAGVIWNDAAEKRVTAIDCQGIFGVTANYLTGSLSLSGCTALEELNCSFNRLGSLDVAGCSALTGLTCYHNVFLDSLDITGCTALKYLDCSESNLTSLDISNCTALEELSCSYSSLEALDVSGLTALTELSCYANYLISLNVTNCSAMTYLDCHNNALTSLDLSGLTALIELSCYTNCLTSLNVTNCSALVYLDCSDNALESLALSGYEYLEVLYCYTNELTSLDVSGCSALTYLDCEYNANLELIWGLNQLEDNIINDIIEFYSDQSLADLLAKERAVLAVVGQITALPAISELTLDDEESVSTAEAAYNGLSAVQKTFVSNYNKLIAAKNKIVELKASLTYTLTITATTGGSITTGSSGNYAAGTVIDITAKPDSGYSFNKWTSAGGGTFANANNASTTYTMPANPATITATFSPSPPPPWYPVSGVTLDKSSLTLEVNGPAQKLAATVQPSYASNRYVYWNSSDTEIARVDYTGLVTPVAPGQAIITATTAEGGKTASCTVTVITTITATAEETIVLHDVPVSINIPPEVEATMEVTPDSTMPQVNINSSTALGTVEIQIPEGTIASGPDDWDGTFKLPTISNQPSVNINGASQVNTVIVLGLEDEQISFSQAVRLLIPGQAQQQVGYIRNGVFTPITRILSADRQDVADSEIPADGDGKIDVDSDLVVWTKHFTEFVIYTPISNPKPASYTVSLSSNYAKAGTVSGDGTFYSGSLITVRAKAQNGYVFDYWSENGSMLSPNSVYSFNLGNSSRQLQANFVREFQELSITDATKPRIITFSHPVLPDEQNLGNIYVATDINGDNKVAGVIVAGVPGNNCQISVKPPDGQWLAGASYYLILEPGLQSALNKTLGIKTRMKFIVE